MTTKHLSDRDMANARRVGTMPNGDKVFRCDVKATWGQSLGNLEGHTRRFTVLARSAAEAANHVRDMFGTVPTAQILTFGPKGGAIERFVGWESAIANELWKRPEPQQLTMEV